MAPKPKDYDEALAQLETAKEKLAEVKTDLREFKQEKKIRRNKPVEDKEIAKELGVKEKAMEDARQEVEDAKAAAKELKPRKERVTKYDYPKDCVTDKDKKKFRAKSRRDVKKAAKEAEEGKDGKKEDDKPATRTRKKADELED
jgi:AAA+ ATPase superfamily predicted ATPase